MRTCKKQHMCGCQLPKPLQHSTTPLIHSQRQTVLHGTVLRRPQSPKNAFLTNDTLAAADWVLIKRSVMITCCLKQDEALQCGEQKTVMARCRCLWVSAWSEASELRQAPLRATPSVCDDTRKCCNPAVPVPAVDRSADPRDTS